MFAGDPETTIEKIILGHTNLEIEINISNLEALLTGQEKSKMRANDGLAHTEVENPNTSNQNNNLEKYPGIHIIKIAHKIAKRGVEAKLILHNADARTPDPDQTLIDIIAKAPLWLSKLTDGSAKSIHDLSKQLDHDSSAISRFLPLAFLAPDIIESILAGTQPVDLTREKLRRLSNLPYQWEHQRKLLGFPS